MDRVEIVDDQDSVVGASTANEAHQDRLPHRVVAVFVFNEEGELYVQVHKISGGKLDHSVGGHVDKGETYAEAANREAEEELGIDQPLTELTTSLYSDEGDRIHMFGLYECVATKEWKFEPNKEVDEIIPMKIEDIRRRMESNPEEFTGGFLNTMKEYCRIKGI